MSTVATAPPVRPIRHGWSKLRLKIGATWYALRQMPPPPGFRSVWVVRKLDPEAAAVTYSVAQAKGEDAACTCPDQEINGAVCKHVMALAAAGLIAKPKAARPPKAPTAKALKAHTRNARAAIAAARQLDPVARRHLADITTSDPVARAHIAEGLNTPQARAALRRDAEIRAKGRAANASLPPAEAIAPAPRPLDELLPAGPVAPARLYPETEETGEPYWSGRSPAAGPFAAGFRSAVNGHVRQLRGEDPLCRGCGEPFAPAAGSPDFCPACAADDIPPLCEGCGAEFQPDDSRDPFFCGACVAERGNP